MSPGLLKNGNGYKNEMTRIVGQFNSDMSIILSMKHKMEQSDKNGLVFVGGSARVKPDNGLADRNFFDYLPFVPKTRHCTYEQAGELAQLLAKKKFAVVIGYGTGFMEASAKGAGQVPDSLVFGVQTQNLARKEGFSDENRIQGYVVNSMEARELAMLANSSAVILFPGGLGTLDELIQALTLMQLRQLPPMPIILMGGKKRWQGFFDWLEAGPIKAGMISAWGQQILKEHVYFPKTDAEVLDILENKRGRPAPLDIFEMTGLFSDDLKKAFESMEKLQHPVIACFGSGMWMNKTDPLYVSAYQMARRVVENGWNVYSDGFGGTMGAVHQAAMDAGFDSVGLVNPNDWPESQDSQRLYIPMSLLCTRNHILRESDADLVFPGGFGTLNNTFKNAVGIQIGELKPRPILLMNYEFWIAGRKQGLVGWMEREIVGNGYADQEIFDILKLVPNHGKEQDRAIEILGESLKEAA